MKKCLKWITNRNLGFKLTIFTSFGESVFSAGISKKPKRGIKTSKGIKLNRDENYSRGLQRTSGGNPPRQSLRGRQVEPASPTLVPPRSWQWPPPVSFWNIPPPPP
jgi:hypothetical protein